MRVLHVLEAVGGGTLRHLEDLVAHTPLDHHVACPVVRSTDLTHPDPTGALRAAGATVHTLAMSRRVLDTANVRALARLRTLIDEVRPDVVHAHASVAGAVARIATPRSLPVVWTPHAVQPRRLVLEVERRLRSRTDIVVALSASEAQRTLTEGLTTDAQLRTIRNGIPTGFPAAAVTRAALGVPESAPVIGFIGRLCDQKAPLHFVEVAAQVLQHRPEAHAVMVGSGPLEEAVRRAAACLPQQRFHRITRDAGAQHLIGALDVLVSPSTYEGGPYLPLEAMHAGVPVVATACPGLGDYVVDRVSGLTAPVGDVNGLVRATERLLDDATLRQGLIASARAYLALVHEVRTMASSYLSLYEDLARPTLSAAPATRAVRLPAQQTR